MKKTLDLRVQKTYRSLQQAFLELLEEKDFEKISVNELCQKAMIRRPTFYKHFLDKYDFLNAFIRWMMEDYFHQALERTRDDQPKTFFFNVFLVLIDEMEKRHHLRFKITIDPTILMELESIRVYAMEIMSQQFMSDDGVDEKKKHDFDFQTRIILTSLINTTIWWMENKETVSKEEIIQKADTLLDKLLA